VYLPKKLNALVQKYELRHKFKIIELVKLAGIAVSTYYCYIKRFDAPDKFTLIKTQIKKVFAENKGRYGYMRITSAGINCKLLFPSLV
jgi:putative transposase